MRPIDSVRDEVGRLFEAVKRGEGDYRSLRSLVEGWGGVVDRLSRTDTTGWDHSGADPVALELLMDVEGLPSLFAEVRAWLKDNPWRKYISKPEPGPKVQGDLFEALRGE